MTQHTYQVAVQVRDLQPRRLMHPKTRQKHVLIHIKIIIKDINTLLQTDNGIGVPHYRACAVVWKSRGFRRRSNEGRVANDWSRPSLVPRSTSGAREMNC